MEFVFHRNDDSISCNHQHVTKNVPARILSRLLVKHLEENRVEFEYREFKRDRGLFNRAKTTNFENRLRRLVDVLRERYSQFRFEKIGRGRFRFGFEDAVSIRFREETEDA